MKYYLIFLIYLSAALVVSLVIEFILARMFGIYGYDAYRPVVSGMALMLAVQAYYKER